MIDLTFSKGKKSEAARSKPVASAMQKITSTIADRIAQCRGYVVPSLSMSVPMHPLGAKSSSPLEGLATMKSDKLDSAAKVVPMPIPLDVETSLPAKKEKTIYVGSCEKSTKLIYG